MIDVKGRVTLPAGTKKRNGEVLNSKAKAKRVAKSEARREAFYAEIGRLYANGEAIADALLAKVKTYEKSRYKIERGKPGAVPRTEDVNVASPYGPGVDRVPRVVDTLSAMLKRKHLSLREYQAADHYRTAFATLGGAMGGSMDFDRARGGSTPGSPPGPHMLIASDTVDQVKAMLYPKDYAVVYRVCALGMSIEETTEQLYGKPSTRSQRDDCSGRLRASLEAMADRWFPENRGRGGNMRSHVTERPTVSDVEAVPQGNAVHATGDKLFRSGRS